jgi:RND family efflux transporter MFP subunit
VIIPRLLVFLCLCLAVAAAPAEDRAVTVSARPAKELGFYPERSAPATVTSLNDSQISAEITGLITDLLVRVGDLVEAGQVVARIGCEDYEIARDRSQAAYEEATARNRLAVSQLKRVERLEKSKNISQEELNQRRSEKASTAAQADQRQAQLAQAERDVSKCLIRAPFDGVIVERYASIGELAVATSKILRLLDTQNVEVSAQVQVQDAPSLNDAASVVFEARDAEYNLQLRTSLPLLDARLGSYEFRLAFTDSLPLPGTSGRLTWREKALHFPAELLVRRDSELGVFVEEAGRARFVAVPDAREGRPVRAPLPDTAQVIIDGRYGLTGGEALVVR